MKKNKRIVVLVFAVLLFSCFTAGASQTNAAAKIEPTQTKKSAAVSPESVIKEVYAIHAQDMKSNGEGRIINSKNRKYLDKYFNKNLADLIWKDLTTHTDEVGVLDFDMFYNAQDFDIKKLTVGRAKITGKKAVVLVSFVNFGKTEKLTYSLEQEKGSWKISDIRYSNSDSLLGYFRDDELSKIAFKNFAGKYQVGETIYDVREKEYDFDVSWTTGSGVKKFFYQGKESGKFVFISDDQDEAKNKFVFDDISLKSGKFVRADGTQVSVKRLK